MLLYKRTSCSFGQLIQHTEIPRAEWCWRPLVLRKL